MKELQDASIQLVEAYGDCMLHSSAIESIGNSYQPGTEVCRSSYFVLPSLPVKIDGVCMLILTLSLLLTLLI